MKTNASSAYAHTRCVQALTAVGVCTDRSIIDVRGLGYLEKQIAKIQRWQHEAAEKTTRLKKLSAGAKRDLDVLFHKMGDAISGLGSDNDNTRFLAWAGNVYAAGLLVWDCLIVAKDYAYGREWRYLNQTLQTLCDKMEELDPEVGVVGTKIYEDIAPRDGAFL